MDDIPAFIVLLPAGESELQAKGTQKVGWGQDQLSPKGLEQAKKAGKLLRLGGFFMAVPARVKCDLLRSQLGVQFDAVFTSMQKQVEIQGVSGIPFRIIKIPG